METVIYNCKRCKKGNRVDYPLKNGVGYGYRLNADGKAVFSGIWITASGGGRPTVYDGDIEAGICKSCNKMMTYGKLNAVLVPEHKCDARCTGARGHDCECSCGGANHGAEWAA